MAARTLTCEERDFFRLVCRAAFANPFSDERVQLDRRIAGFEASPGEGDLVRRLVGQVRGRITQLDGDEWLQVADFAGEDRRLMEAVYLFDVFHAFIAPLDRTIEQQVQAATEPVPVGYARDLLGALTRRGFDRDLALKLFALFFQIRRAYYFIDRGLLGRTASMRRFRAALWNTLFTCDLGLYQWGLWDRMEDFSIMLLGPTGAGKGAAAAAIGRSGFIPFDERRGVFAESFEQTFVSVNLSEYAETLLESALFGHAKGAFTGAISQHQGVFSRCRAHGAIFLDEIGDVSRAVQVKLLKVLEERQFTPVGSQQSQRFQGRVIAATHRDLGRLRREGQLRDDFYYRLCSDCIVVPSLRERIQEDPAELDLLIGHTIERLLGRRHDELAARVRRVVDERLGPDYPWPGNVRELAQCVRRVILRCDYQGDPGPTPEEDPLWQAIRCGALRAEDLLARYCRLLYDRFGTYEEVARRVDLDRRTVKRYVTLSQKQRPEEV